MGASDSRLSLRQAVFRLYEEKEIPVTEAAFWNNFATAVVTADDVFAVVSPKDIRSAITKAPRNMHTLVVQCIERIVAATADTAVPMAAAGSQPVLNSLRILTRVFPFLCEDRTYAWADNLWNKPLPSSSASGTVASSAPVPDGSAAAAEPPAGPLTAADALVDGVFRLLFLPGFTLAPTVKRRKDGTFFIIWETGIAARSAPPTTVQIDANRAETLKLLLVLMSGVMYINTEELKTRGVAWTLRILQRATPTIVMALLASLLNIVCAYDPIGYGVPYNYLMFADPKEALAEVAAQALLVLIDYEYPLRTDAGTAAGQAAVGEPTERPRDQQEEDLAHGEQPGAATADPSVPITVAANLGVPNIFQDYLARIHRNEDFDVLVAGLVRLLHVPIQSTSTYLPGSRKTLRFAPELVLLLWRTVEINRKFASYLLRDVALPKLLLALLFYLSEFRRDEAKYSVVHMVGFILLLLSGDRNFGVRLNMPYKEVLPALKLPVFEGNYADVLILALHRVIVDGGRALAPLYDCLLTVLANVAPYIKSISALSAMKLVGLLRMLTSPSFLLDNAANADLSVILLEVIHSMLQYQMDGNTRLVYTVLRHASLFNALATFDYATAVAKLQVVHTHEALDGTIQLLSGEITTPVKAAAAAAAAGGTEAPTTPSSTTAAAATATSPTSPTTPQRAPAPAAASATEHHTTPSRRTAATAAAHPRFVPNEEWVAAYRRRLPLQTIMRLLQVLSGPVEKICAENPYNSEDAVVKYLANGTLVGLLPLPSPIMVRRYKPTIATRLWMTVQLWGIIYLSHLHPPVWYGTQIGLFIIHSIPTPTL